MYFGNYLMKPIQGVELVGKPCAWRNTGVVWHHSCSLDLLRKRREIPILKKEADYIVDFKGAIKSLTLLKLTHVFRAMKSDEVIKIMGLDPDTRNDLFKVLQAISYELVFEEERDGEFCNIHLKKRNSEPTRYH